MIELNLLPKEFRKKKKHSAKILSLPSLPIAAGVLAVFIALNFVLGFFDAHSRNSLAILKEKWDSMRPEREKTEKLTNEILSLEKRAAAIRKIAKPDLNWTKLLEGLSQAVTANIWVSEFELKSAKLNGSSSKDKGFIEIEGYALGKSEQATRLVSKFISNLEGIKEFSDSFETIELKNINKREFAEEEVMLFRLYCNFKEAKGA